MSKSVAIVTGASQGMAAPQPFVLRKDFSAIALAARGRDNLEATAAAVKAAGAEPLVIDLDLADVAAPKKIVDETLAKFGRIDALLNIAGAVPQIDLFEMTDEQWDGGMALKLHGARRLAIAAWPELKKAKGAVVFMSGNSAVFPKAPYAAVGTINAAIVALAKAFSDRGVTDGVQVNSVLPGPVVTGRRKSYLEHWAPLHNMTVEEATEKFPKDAGIARYGKPEEIAELMAFLVSPGARWMTGSTLRMDGGEVKSIWLRRHERLRRTGNRMPASRLAGISMRGMMILSRLLPRLRYSDLAIFRIGPWRINKALLRSGAPTISARTCCAGASKDFPTTRIRMIPLASP